jgi:hypothetical protein
MHGSKLRIALALAVAILGVGLRDAAAQAPRAFQARHVPRMVADGTAPRVGAADPQPPTRSNGCS